MSLRRTLFTSVSINYCTLSHAMRVSSLYVTRQLQLSVARQSGRTACGCQPCNIRGITTTRALPVAQTGNTTSTEDRLSMVRAEHGLRIRRTSYPRTKTPEQFERTYCAYLLNLNPNISETRRRHNYTNQRVRVNCMIKSIRKQKHGAFAHVTDGSCVQAVQVVLAPDLAAP